MNKEQVPHILPYEYYQLSNSENKWWINEHAREKKQEQKVTIIHYFNCLPGKIQRNTAFPKRHNFLNVVTADDQFKNATKVFTSN